MRPKAKGGTDGLIPSRHVGRLLSYALANKLPVTAESFVLMEDAA